MEQNREHNQQLSYLKRKLEDLEAVHKNGKISHHAEMELMKADLERSKRQSREQAEQIARLKKQRDLSESTVQDLRRTVFDNKLEIKELRQRLQSAEQDREKLAGKQSNASELRRAHMSAEARLKRDLEEKDSQISKLKGSLSDLQLRVSMTDKDSEDARLQLERRLTEAERRRDEVEQDLYRARSQLDKIQSDYTALKANSSSMSDSYTSQVAQVQSTLRAAAAEYGRLASSTVPLMAHKKLKADWVRWKLRAVRLERKLANSDEQVRRLAYYVRQLQETNAFLCSQIQDAKEELVWHMTANRNTAAELYVPPDLSLNNAFESVYHEQSKEREEEWRYSFEIVNNLLGQCCAVSSELVECYAYNERALSQERARSATLASRLSELDANITMLSAAVEAERKKHDTISNENARNISEIHELQGKLETARKDMVLSETRARADGLKREELLRKERELSGRLQSAIQKNKMAEDALRAEIEQLSRDLGEVEVYREAYQKIAEEMRGLVARNALAEEETERLSKFNAEILGHHNPTQRILYVDKIRRELAETKQRLAVSSRDTEAALEKAEQLNNELAMYKSVAVPFEGKPRTNMTRIRRIPLGPQIQNALEHEVDHDQHLHEAMDEIAFQRR